MDKWYYMVNGQQQGPASKEDLQSKLASGQIPPAAFVWSSGMKDWLPANAVDSLITQQKTTPPPQEQVTPQPEAQAEARSSKLGLKKQAPQAQAAAQQAPQPAASVVAAVPGAYGPPRSSTRPAFLYISPARLIIMSILSFGIFEMYWIYKNWRYIKDRDGYTISPFWRAVFGVFHCHSLLNTIHDDNELNSGEEATFPAGMLATGWVILIILSNARLESAGIPEHIINIVQWIQILLPTWMCLLPVQNYINRANRILAPDARYSPWSFGQILSLLPGLIVWAAIALQFVLGIVAPELLETTN